jgi:hypothetical protein
MSRPLALFRIGTLAAAVVLLPEASLAFNPQPDPPGKAALKQQETSLGGPDTKSKSKSGRGSHSLPAVQKRIGDSDQLPAVQKGGDVGVDHSNPHTPAWVRDAFGNTGGGGGDGGGGGR